MIKNETSNKEIFYGAEMRNIRIKNDIKSKAVAEILELKNPRYCQYENKDRNVPAIVLDTFCTAYECSIESFRAYENKKTFCFRINKRINLEFEESKICQLGKVMLFEYQNEIHCAEIIEDSNHNITFFENEKQYFIAKDDVGKIVYKGFLIRLKSF